MRATLVVVLSVMCAVGLCEMVVAGSLDSAGAPSSGSGMYSLSQIYDYLNSGIKTTPVPSFQGPGAAPAPTMKSTKEIYNEIVAKFDRCNVTADNVELGKLFFCTQPGNWGVQTGTLSALPRPTATPTITPTQTMTPTLTPTITPTSPPTPSAGGEWVLVPGTPTYHPADFWVMKYETKNVGGAKSQADTTPWVLINLADAKSACEALGSGYHLMTVAEAQTINRNLEQVAANWADSTIGSTIANGGGLKRGNIGLTDSASYDGPNPDYAGAGAGSDRSSTSKAKLVLSNGQEIWDWSGNVWEWIWGSGAGGSVDNSGGIAWRSTGGWIQWSDGDLNEERSVLGPSSNLYTSTHGMGQYNGASSGQAFLRGGNWADTVYGGCYSLGLFNSPTDMVSNIGFRCCK